jgi:8-oxo-dGTP diphosphatase
MNIRVGVNAVIVQNDAILVVEFDDETGLHFNLPGGGVEEGESIQEALVREVVEETCAKVSVGPLLLVTEYFPPRYQNLYGPTHKVGFFFECRLLADSQPHLPEQADPNQVGVQWLPLANLPNAPLLPRIADRLLAMLTSRTPANPFCDEV